jgi:hypothetical protein
MARRAPAQKGFSLTISFDSGGSQLDVRHITQVGELVKVLREAWVGGQRTYVRQKLAIRHYAPSAG